VISAPDDRIDAFEEGARAAIDVISSGAFVAELAAFLKKHAHDSDLSDSWADADAEDIAARLRKEIQGASVKTFGGVRGAFDSVFYGTVAIERRNRQRPVEFNRWGLKGRTPAEIANSVVHEIAHGIGLRHPHMPGPPKSWDSALCEPPYLIGALVEKIAAGDEWKWTAAYCARM
jgi:hypothetical protein